MRTISKKIMNRMRRKGRREWVATPKDFLDLGSRASVDQALARLVKKGKIRRIGRGLYDIPRFNRILGRLAVPNPRAAVAAIGRRDGTVYKLDGIFAANGLGLTNAVPAKLIYLTAGPTKFVQVGGRRIKFEHASPTIMAWQDRPGDVVIRALDWLGPWASQDKRVIPQLRRVLPDDVKMDLAKGIESLPGWMADIVRQVCDDTRQYYRVEDLPADLAEHIREAEIDPSFDDERSVDGIQ